MLENRYLRDRVVMEPLIDGAPSTKLSLVVVIPAKDEVGLCSALESLWKCDRPKGVVEVIIVVNASEADSIEVIERNANAAREAKAWADSHQSDSMIFHILECLALPRRDAGVGLARKVGMDEACRRFESVRNPRGVIVCFDADSSCASNYLIEIESLFARDHSCQACSIHFEHPISGTEHPQEVYRAIILYELHLRYFIGAQRWSGFPFATQTIGSSMAVRCDAYQQQNGMNKRKAGEDFYFFHKFTVLGHVRELTTTCVYPSPRPSHRVPFGTGKAVADYLASGGQFLTYAPESFKHLRQLFEIVPTLASTSGAKIEQLQKELPESLTSFLEIYAFSERVLEIQSGVTSAAGFRVRFFRWFNAFLIMKFLHHSREHFYPDVPVETAAAWLLKERGIEVAKPNPEKLLRQYRELDRKVSQEV